MIIMNDFLKQPVTALKGIGEETAKQLESIKVYDIWDLIEYFPFRYEDYRLKDLHEVKHD